MLRVTFYFYFIFMFAATVLGTADDETPFVAKPRQTVLTFIETLLDMLPEASKYWGRFAQFFHVLLGFGQLGELERAYLIRRHTIGALFDFMLPVGWACACSWEGICLISVVVVMCCARYQSGSPHPELNGKPPRPQRVVRFVD